MQSAIVLFAVFAATEGNATVFSTLGLFRRAVGLSELEVGAIFASAPLLFFLTSSCWGRTRPAKTAEIMVDCVRRDGTGIYAAALCGGCLFQFHGNNSAMRLVG